MRIQTHIATARSGPKILTEGLSALDASIKVQVPATHIYRKLYVGWSILQGTPQTDLECAVLIKHQDDPVTLMSWRILSQGTAQYDSSQVTQNGFWPPFRAERLAGDAFDSFPTIGGGNDCVQWLSTLNQGFGYRAFVVTCFPFEFIADCSDVGLKWVASPNYTEDNTITEQAETFLAVKSSSLPW